MRRALLLALPVALLAAGGTAVLLRGDDGPASAAYEPHTASVSDVPGIDPSAQPSAVFASSDLPPASAAPTAEAAVRAYLAAVAAGRVEDAAALLPDGERRRFTTLASFGQFLTEEPPAGAAEVLTARPDPTGTGDVEVEVRVRRTPTLDTVRGLVPAESLETWRAVPAAGGFRVAPAPVESRAVLPPLATATRDAQAWVTAAGACRTAEADRLVVDRIGPSALFSTPCAYRGAWSAAAPLAYDDVEGTQPLLDQYGPSVRHWSRYVPVTSPGAPPLLVALAPLGDGWRVVGVLPDTAATGG